MADTHGPFTNQTMDACAMRIHAGQETEEIRNWLIHQKGLTPYNAFLCFKAAQLMVRSTHS